MRIRLPLAVAIAIYLTACSPGDPSTSAAGAETRERHTEVSIVGDQFYINGRPTYEGRTWNGHRIEGLLFNSRMVQGIFDDLNPETRHLWAYPDTRTWDPERNTREFIDAMPEWRRHGLLSFTINLQGGSPQGYSREQPWHNSAIDSLGNLRPEYMARLERILDRADELGMVPILGIFYFGQDERLRDEQAVIRAVDNTLEWLADRGYRNVLIEINNEANVRYDHEILQPERVHELIERVKAFEREGHRFLVSTSYGGGSIPRPNVVRTADFLLLHGNGVEDPARLAEMVRETRAVEGYRPMPILVNEDDHYEFEQPDNNLVAAISEYASWGFFDFRREGEAFEEGYQSVPVDWGINSARKRAFFDLLAEITGSDSAGVPTFESIEKIDIHAHYFDESPDYLVELLRRINMKVVNVSNRGTDGYVETMHRIGADLARRYPDRMEFASTFNLRRVGESGFAEEAIAQLDRSFEAGAVMTKIWKEVGLELKTPSGEFLLPDDPVFDPIYAHLAERGIPLLAHLAEPREAWLPLDSQVVHYNYYSQNPEWHLYGKPEYPSHEELIAARDHILEKHPDLIVIGAHLGSLEHDVDEVAARLDRYPNFYVDVAARTRDLTYQPTEKVRSFFLRYPDRILYGLDAVFRPFRTGPVTVEDRKEFADGVEARYRRDFAFYASPDSVDYGNRRVQGLGLPVEVLEMFYSENARRLLGDGIFVSDGGE
ncbi:MAG TPA: amidohydrolase family protein [Longimicrobiaceae bacterium]